MEKKRSKIQSKQKERVIMIRKEINKIELKKTMGKKKKMSPYPGSQRRKEKGLKLKSKKWKKKNNRYHSYTKIKRMLLTVLCPENWTP